MLTGKPIVKRPLGKPRHRWEVSFRINVLEIGVNVRNWMDSFQDKGYWRDLWTQHFIFGCQKPCNLLLN